MEPVAFTAAEATLFHPRAYVAALPRLLHRQNARQRRDARVLLVGDSHVALWTKPGAGWPGPAQRLAALDLACFGGPGDGANHLRWRIERGEFDGCAPELLVVAIGGNMLATWLRPWVVAQAIADAAELLRCRVGARRVVLHAVLPRIGAPAWHTERREALHEHLAAAAGVRGWTWFDPSAAFVERDGLASHYYHADGVHLSADGYAQWAAVLLAGLAGQLSASPAKSRPVGVSPLFWRGMAVAQRAKRAVQGDQRRAA